MKPRLLFWSVFFGLLITDLATKAWIRNSLPEHGSINGLPWPGVFELTLKYNEGIAFGLFQGAGVFLTPVAIAIAVGAMWYSWTHPKETFWGHLSMALLAAGAVGNLYDRLFFGKVTDMFWFRTIDFPVFNVADSCITVAATILIISWVKEGVAQKPEKSNPADLGEKSAS